MPEIDDLVLAIDQGTSSTKALLIDHDGVVVARGQAMVSIEYPQRGWVEQSPEEIWASVEDAVGQCLRAAPGRRVGAVGLSTQRESVTLWERATAKPCGPMLGWQDRRTASASTRMRATPETAETVRRISGLPLDPMFSALKANWLLDRYDPDRRRSLNGELCLGTVDAWLLRKLTGVHQIEIGNASRTQLLDVRAGEWSEELLHTFGVPHGVLPAVVPSMGSHFGDITGIKALYGVPVTAVLADSHAALFAHGAVAPGQIKATYGTGSSILGLLDTPDSVSNGLCLTIAWQAEAVTYACEGNIQATGATLVWLANLLDLAPGDVVDLGETAVSEGVALVPAFDGLAAPWWDEQASALIVGLSLSTTRDQLARAALESVTTQVSDVVEAMLACTPGGSDFFLLADGGISTSDVVMQMQADMLGIPVHRAHNPELSALGAGYLAQMGSGCWSRAGVAALHRDRDTFDPGPSRDAQLAVRKQWAHALQRSRWRPADQATDAAAQSSHRPIRDDQGANP